MNCINIFTSCFWSNFDTNSTYHARQCNRDILTILFLNCNIRTFSYGSSQYIIIFQFFRFEASQCYTINVNHLQESIFRFNNTEQNCINTCRSVFCFHQKLSYTIHPTTSNRNNLSIIAFHISNFRQRSCTCNQVNIIVQRIFTEALNRNSTNLNIFKIYIIVSFNLKE